MTRWVYRVRRVNRDHRACGAHRVHSDHRAHGANGDHRGHGLDGGKREDHRFSDADSAGYREPPDLLALADGATGYVEAAILRLRDMSPR